MTFVSYSQNAEDVLLWRALGHIDAGFYIDVGASDPVEHSVTKAFYERGWRGISIEPLPSFQQEFERQRPRDINLAIAAGAEDGELTLYDTPEVRGWASPDQAVAEMHRAEGHRIAELTVPVRTLASVCEEYVRGEIHFLKIDVEGFEGDVLRGMDFARWRPWLLVIEATLPNSRETNHASWEHLVAGQGYRFVWFDGLNRWYVAEEHPELMGHFGIAPNVFDDYISHHLDKAWRNGEALAATLHEVDARARAQMEAAEQRLALLDRELRAANEAAAHEARHADQQRLHFEEEMRRAGKELDRVEAVRAHFENETLRANEEIGQLQEKLAQVHESARHLSDWARGLDQRLQATLASTSWKVTAPLRKAGAIVHSLRRPDLARRLATRLSSNERVRRTVIPVLRSHPALGEKVSAAIAAIKLDAAPPDGVIVPEELKGLPLSARAVLADLRRARGEAQAGS